PEPANPARDATAVLLRLLGTGTVCVVLPHHPGYDLLPPERLHPSSRGGIRSQDRNAERIRQEAPAVPAAAGATSPLDGAGRCGEGRGCGTAGRGTGRCRDHHTDRHGLTAGPERKGSRRYSP